MKRVLSLLLGLCCLIYCKAQEKESTIDLVYQSSSLGIGHTSLYDTYLSPLEYKGTTVGLFHEQMKMTRLMDGNVSAQHQFSIDFAWTDNETETATDYNGIIEYRYGLHYRLRPARNLQVFAGAQADALLGFIYNTRNGNNPATGKVNINLNLSAIATYGLQLKKQTINLRYQINAPVAGIMYSPQFGQSYYEIGLGDDKDLIHFASFHNQLILQNMISLELPLDFMTLRLSYRNSCYETRINELETRIHSNMFFIGLTKNFFSVPGRKQRSSNYNSVF